METVDPRLTPAHRRYLKTLAQASSPVRVHARVLNPILDELCAWRYAQPVTFQKHSEDYAITERGREQLRLGWTGRPE